MATRGIQIRLSSCRIGSFSPAFASLVLAMTQLSLHTEQASLSGPVFVQPWHAVETASISRGLSRHVESLKVESLESRSSRSQGRARGRISLGRAGVGVDGRDRDSISSSFGVLVRVLLRAGGEVSSSNMRS